MNIFYPSVDTYEHVSMPDIRRGMLAQRDVFCTKEDVHGTGHVSRSSTPTAQARLGVCAWVREMLKSPPVLVLSLDEVTCLCAMLQIPTGPSAIKCRHMWETVKSYLMVTIWS